MLLSSPLTPLGASHLPLPTLSHQKHCRLVVPHLGSIPLVKPSLILCSVSLQKSVPSSPSGDSISSPENGDAGSGLSPSSSSSSFFHPIATAKRVVLVRHGQSTWNAEGRIQGSSDFSVLTLKGEAQAETSRQMLLTDNFDVCFHSPLIRSKRTAEIIWADRKEQMIPEYDLREIDLYSFQGLLKHEGKAKYGDAYRQWQTDAANFNIDGHYPVRELWERARNSWNKILRHDGPSILVVAHNAVNQALVATAIGLGTEYFRVLLQSNCGVSVLDFTPSPGRGSPHIRLNRLNQTPSSPVSAGSSGGRKASNRIILVCHGALEGIEGRFSWDEPMNMLGVIQSQKTAELLLDLNVSSVACSPLTAAADTATTISKVQEAADCLGVDCVPRDVEIMKMPELLHISGKQGLDENAEKDVLRSCTGSSELWERAREAWSLLLEKLANLPGSEKNLVVVSNPIVNVGLVAHCLNLQKEWLPSFHLDEGSVSVIDFPDGPSSNGVIRCINYTAHLGRWSIPVTRTTNIEEELQF
ncbi:2-carboxy-D-arabinitol-1-phosphatase [Nymphaea thermarum]|nr:2-carboxy-D-arabinitol-1-phosphatase [Nymphaea thermarum]